MKNALSFFITALLPILLHAQSGPTEGQKEVQETVVHVFAKLAEQDSVAMKSYFASDAALYENGQVWNVDSLVKKGIRFNIGVDFKRTNKFDFISTTIKENTAWVTYNLYSDMQRGERKASVHWMETIILVKEKKQWKIKVLHSTLIKRS